MRATEWIRPEHDRSRGEESLDDESHLRRLALIGELTASTLHQINGPLTYLLLNLERLRRAVTDPDASRALGDAREGAEVIRALSRDVMSLARGGPSHGDIVDVRSVVETALRITGARIRAAAAVVEDYLASPRVWGDATLLLQVVTNGLVNAADACAASVSPGRTIRVCVETDGIGHAVVSIIDNGVGASREQVARVFDPFFTTKGAGQGTGLGLSLAKRIVEREGGELAFDSTEGVGSVLRVTLPAMGDD